MPASVYEAPGFERVANKIFISIVLVLLVLNFSISGFLIFSPEAFYAFESAVRPMRVPLDRLGLLARWEELTHFGHGARVPFLVTYVVGTATLPLSVLVLLAAYFRKVILPGHAVFLDLRALLGALLLMFLGPTVYWFSYLMEVDLTEQRYIGIARAFTWPWFTFIGVITYVFETFVIFILIAGLLKLVFQNPVGEKDA